MTQAVATHTEGFALEDGKQAPGIQPNFMEITCPRCRKRMAVGMEHIIVLHQSEDDPMSRVFIHSDCLVAMAEELKGSTPVMVRRG